jgi:hypothetical protein
MPDDPASVKLRARDRATVTAVAMSAIIATAATSEMTLWTWPSAESFSARLLLAGVGEDCVTV